MADLYSGAILNAYPDSVGGHLKDIVSLLKRDECKDVFSMFYILPSVFNTDLDRGFSIISYDLSETLADPQSIEDIRDMKIELLMDFILNHISVLSKQFQDIVANGDNSQYRDFFIDWNRFWEGCGEMTAEGYIQPKPELIRNMFFRKPGLPILMIRFPDGRDVPYWNTFYQEVRYTTPDPLTLVRKLGLQYGTACAVSELVKEAIEAGKTPAEIDFGNYTFCRDSVVNYLESERKYLGQMDVNVKSPLVWDYYRETLKKLADYGVSIVRLDAFAYASKEVGSRNFLNDPEVWDLLQKVDDIATPLSLKLLPEIHASYEEGTYRILADKGYMVYDFFLPGLIIDAFERKNGSIIQKWAQEILTTGMKTVNMLGCHDGIPLLDLKGLLNETEIQNVIDTVVARGGFVKNLHGAKNVYYQVNATYYSALGEDDRKMLAARAIQLFMPGKPQIWYLDLFAGKNDYEAMARAGAGGHKEINRTNLSLDTAYSLLHTPVVEKQLELLRLRNTCGVFTDDANITTSVTGSDMTFRWENSVGSAELKVSLLNADYTVTVQTSSETVILRNI